MYLPRVSLVLFTRNFSSRLSLLSVMKSRDAWILLSQTSPPQRVVMTVRVRIAMVIRMLKNIIVMVIRMLR